jgi:hypothetical protein
MGIIVRSPLFDPVEQILHEVNGHLTSENLEGGHFDATEALKVLPGLRCEYANGTTAAIPNNVITQFGWLAADRIYDNDRMLEPGGTGFVVNTPGKYLVQLNVQWTTPAAVGVRLIQILRIPLATGANENVSRDRKPTAGAVGDEHSICLLQHFEKGDRIQTWAFQNSGGAGTIGPVGAGELETSFALQWLSP